MRKLLFIGILLSANFLFAQDKFIVEYKQTSETDQEKEKELEKKFAEKGLGSFKSSSNSTFYYQLEYDQGTSFYKEMDKVNNAQGSMLSPSLSINIGGVYKGIINDLNSKNYKQNINLEGENYIVISPYEDYQWKITDIEETILGYRTIKAIGVDERGKQIAAWYTPEINVETGPKKINGLSGLILKAVVDLGGGMKVVQTLIAEKINFNPRKITNFKSLKGEEINQEQFKVLQEKSKEKMMKSFSMGVETKID